MSRFLESPGILVGPGILDGTGMLEHTIIKVIPRGKIFKYDQIF